MQALAPPPVDQARQGLEQTGHPLDFVQDDQLFVMRRQIQLGVGKLRAVGIGFEVEVKRVALIAKLLCQRGLDHQTRPQEGNGGAVVQQVVQGGGEGAINHHPCNRGY